MAVMMLFFSASMTIMTYALDAISPEPLNYVDPFSDVASQYNKQNISEQMSQQINKQKSMPLIEMGALLFYSGNFLLDMAVNFIFAIPQMLGLIINGIGMLFNFDPDMVIQIQLFLDSLMGLIYIISLLQMLLSIRTGGSKIL
jgi:hypothetical protein